MNIQSATQQWHNDGLVHVREALSRAEVQAVLNSLDPLIDSRRGPETAHTVRIDNAIECTDALDALLDHPVVFPLLVRFLGTHLTLLGSEVYARYASDDDIHALHMDGGPSLWRVALAPDSICLSLKVQFFLTDVDVPDNGNFTYVAGSHRLRPKVGDDDVVFPPEIVESRKRQLLAKAGDAVLFPWNLWHAVAPNVGHRTRKSVILRFGQLWIRPNDHWHLTDQTLTRMTPRRRRLCGDLGDTPYPTEWYFPANQPELILGQSH